MVVHPFSVSTRGGGGEATLCRCCARARHRASQPSRRGRASAIALALKGRQTKSENRSRFANHIDLQLTVRRHKNCSCARAPRRAGELAINGSADSGTNVRALGQPSWLPTDPLLLE